MASFTHETPSPLPHSTDRAGQGRPTFSSHITSDRLREGKQWPETPRSNKKPERKSVFREEGLDDVSASHDIKNLTPVTEAEKASESNVTFEGILKDLTQKEDGETVKKRPWFSKMTNGSRPIIKTSSSAPPGLIPSVTRAALIVFLIAVVVPGFRYSGGRQKVNISGADAGIIRAAEFVDNGNMIKGRQSSPTTVCTRWSHQTANVNGTLFVFGGQATTESKQTANTWNNDFFTLDLTKTWEIASPSLSGLPQPSGPPAVAEGYLWHSYTSLFLYGGEFSDNPSASPLPVSTWEYNIGSSTWTEYPNPATSAGNSSDGGNIPVQRSAEGAGLSIPELGLSYYFGGHLDMYTSEGWSNQVARQYLKSLLEFTHPGYANTGVFSLGSTTAAGGGGAYRNITQGGLQVEDSFTERADGVLVYVPGWGDAGIILGLAGGTNQTFTEMNIIDVYDIASSTWYKQSTSGASPPIRVNPCAVVAAAPDGSSFNVYLYGGQNLIPFGNQTQYSDMWILTIPSFTWIPVDMSGQLQPPARAGHTCSIWDGQIVIVGGYVGEDSPCDSPGIYVFNASSLQWANSFTSLSSLSSASSGLDYSGSGSFLQASILEGSYGYAVPAVVQSVIGGSSAGGATVSTPAAGSATAGPIATGRPPTFTVTQSGSTVIQTAQSTTTASSSGQAKTTPGAKSSANVGVITASVVAGVLAILVGYLAFCRWLYRRQLRLYKDHVAMAQRAAFSGSPENWSSSGGAGGSGVGKMSENIAAEGAFLGPFGTEMGGSGSVRRPSVGESSGAGTGRASPSPGLTSVESNSQGSGGVYGGSVMPGRGYGRLSEADEDAEYIGAHQPSGWGRPSTGQSSMEDLLAGQEPSFFSVVLNPRRTLRVVNTD